MTTTELPDPGADQALATAGMLIHHVASDPARREAFARWIEHCPGDVDDATLIAYLEKVHAVLEPGCDIPATTDPTLLPSDDDHGHA